MSLYWLGEDRISLKKGKKKTNLEIKQKTTCETGRKKDSVYKKKEPDGESCKEEGCPLNRGALGIAIQAKMETSNPLFCQKGGSNRNGENTKNIIEKLRPFGGNYFKGENGRGKSKRFLFEKKRL